MLGTIISFCFEKQSWSSGDIYTIVSLLGYCYIRYLKDGYKKTDTKIKKTDKHDDFYNSNKDTRKMYLFKGRFPNRALLSGL